MDPLLKEGWLDAAPAMPVLDEASIALVRERVRREGTALGFSAAAIGAAVNVASELGHNQLAHARDGEIAVRRIAREGVAGLEIVAADEGGGIHAPSAALAGRPRLAPNEVVLPGASLGIGLAAVLELADEVDFDVRLGEGTCVWARKFGGPVARRREVGVFGRPCPGEIVSGDHGFFARGDDALLVAVADGLGHGPEAREASNVAIDAVRALLDRPLARLFDECHEALRKTRGVVMAVGRLAEPHGALETGIVGNVTAHIHGQGGSRRISGPSFVLGAPGRVRRTGLEDHYLAARDVLLLFTDGLTTRADLDDTDELLREHPIVIAERMIERFGRDNDDALVLVVR